MSSTTLDKSSVASKYSINDSNLPGLSESYTKEAKPLNMSNLVSISETARYGSRLSPELLQSAKISSIALIVVCEGIMIGRHWP